MSQIEQEIRIRARYLRALEEEQFDLLPGSAYARAFLRQYADFLGLDGQQFVDEYDARFVAVEQAPVLLPTAPRRRPALRARVPVLLVAVLLALIGWRLASGGGHEATPPPAPRPLTTVAATTAPVRTSSPATRPAAVARLALVASRGRCWISVRLGSAQGRLLFERTLEPGQTARFVARRLWIRLGAPSSLDATLNGRAVQLPTALGNVVVTPTRIVATGFA